MLTPEQLAREIIPGFTIAEMLKTGEGHELQAKEVMNAPCQTGFCWGDWQGDGIWFNMTMAHDAAVKRSMKNQLGNESPTHHERLQWICQDEDVAWVLVHQCIVLCRV
jgi:hypothetical protein